MYYELCTVVNFFLIKEKFILSFFLSLEVMCRGICDHEWAPLREQNVFWEDIEAVTRYTLLCYRMQTREVHLKLHSDSNNR